MKDLNTIIADLETARAEINRQIKLFRKLEVSGGTMSKNELEKASKGTLPAPSLDRMILNARYYNIGLLRDAGFSNKEVSYRVGLLPARTSQIYAAYKNNK